MSISQMTRPGFKQRPRWPTSGICRLSSNILGKLCARQQYKSLNVRLFCIQHILDLLVQPLYLCAILCITHNNPFRQEHTHA